jgi:hypothetical protein
MVTAAKIVLIVLAVGMVGGTLAYTFPEYLGLTSDPASRSQANIQPANEAPAGGCCSSSGGCCCASKGKKCCCSSGEKKPNRSIQAARSAALVSSTLAHGPLSAPVLLQASQP